MPGESASDAIAAAVHFRTLGIGAVLTQLGEQVTSGAEVVAVREHYLGLMDRLRADGVQAQLSVKLSQLGLGVDRDLCAECVASLAARAQETAVFLWIDMEESRYVEATLDVFRAVRAGHRAIGLCVQAYLRRTPADLESLLPLAPAIRLVKGAYREPPDVAFTQRRDVDEAFYALGARLLDAATTGGAPPVFGTHDLQLIQRLRAHAMAIALPPRRYEVHMLYGIRTADQRVLAADGVTVRALISYGSSWFPWYMRRLAERPANLVFVLRSVFR